ncbi:MAG: hypothetical protein ABH828_01970 [archaeon]
MIETNLEQQIKYMQIVSSIIIGPVLGLAPERKQLEWTEGDRKEAFYMSATSRILNGLWATYSIVSLITKAFGQDIDPTPGNIATYAGIPLIPDTILREAGYLFFRGLTSPFREKNQPWGEPLLTYIDNKKHPEWYKTH